MRVSQQFTTTLREVPHDSEGGNQELLIRGGFIRQLTAGVYSFLPLGNRVIRKISQIIREEMDRAGAQEITMPVMQPKDIWAMKPASGPSHVEMYGPVLFSLKDRKGREMVLGPTHEEIVTLLGKDFIRSYRDLPRLVYQIQIKFRDEPRPRGGLLRTREFLMKDLYSFDADAEGLDASYRKIAEAYRAVFTRCGLRFIVIHADSGAIGGKESQEFIAITEAGEDDALVCNNCDYAANVEKAEFVRTELAKESEATLEEVYTPGCMTIADLAAFLKIPEAKTMKSVCYVADGKLVLAVVRGDLEINEIKLTNTLYGTGINAADLHLATPEELEKVGIVAGYTSPLNKIVGAGGVRSGVGIPAPQAGLHASARFKRLFSSAQMLSALSVLSACKYAVSSERLRACMRASISSSMVTASCSACSLPLRRRALAIRHACERKTTPSSNSFKRFSRSVVPVSVRSTIKSAVSVNGAASSAPCGVIILQWVMPWRRRNWPVKAGYFVAIRRPRPLCVR